MPSHAIFTRLLTASDIRALIDMGSAVKAVEEVFMLHGQKRTFGVNLVHEEVQEGEFHLKTGGIDSQEPVFGLKLNGGFFQNGERFGLPAIQGTILLCSAVHGGPLAVVDSTEITAMRTAAATALAAKYLAREDAQHVAIFGSGRQARAQLEAMSLVRPVRSAAVWSRNRASAESFAEVMGGGLGIPIRVAANPGDAAAGADICITCTPSREPFLMRSMVEPGTFVSAVGADSPDKQEIESALLSGSRVVLDIQSQCEAVGELHHAMRQGCVPPQHGFAELGQVVIGAESGRSNQEEITLFDSTGTALQDIALAALAYRLSSDEKGIDLRA